MASPEMTFEEFSALWDSLPESSGEIPYGPATPGATELFIGKQPEEEPGVIREGLNTAALAGQGLFGNYLDEALSVPSGLVKYALSGGSESLGSSIASEQEVWSNILKQASEETPVMGTIAEIGGSVISPINKIMPGGGLFKKAAGAGIQGLIGGFGAGDSLEDRVSKGLLGGGLGAGLSGAAGVTGKAMRGYENILKGSDEATQLAEAGLTPSAITKSALRSPRKPGEKAGIIESAKRLIKSGDLKPGDAVENQLRLEVENEVLGKQLGNIYKQADAVLPGSVPIQFRETLDWIASQKNDRSQEKLLKLLKEEATPLMKKGRITFSDAARNSTDLFKESKETLGMQGTDPLLGELKKYMALDIKKGIDAELKKPIYKQQLGSDVYNEMLSLKEKMTDRFSVLPALAQRGSREILDTAKDKGRGLIATTGGLGSLMGATAIATGGAVAPLTLATLAAPLFLTPGGRIALGKVSEKAGGLAGLFGGARLGDVAGSRLFGGVAGQVLGARKEDSESELSMEANDIDTKNLTFEEFSAIWDSLPSESGDAAMGTDKKKVSPRKVLEMSLDEAGISDPKERAQFLGQMAHESANFSALQEIGGGKRYEGRKDLGNTEKGDGERFKGRGFIQLTGRANYKRYGDMIGVDLENNPELAADPEVAAKLAIAYWQDRVKPKVSDFSDTKKVTKIINGGYNGLSDRLRKVALFMPKDKKSNEVV